MEELMGHTEVVLQEVTPDERNWMLRQLCQRKNLMWQSA